MIHYVLYIKGYYTGHVVVETKMSIKIAGINLKPEIEKPLYWLHLGIISFLSLFMINLIMGSSCDHCWLTLPNWFYVTLIVGLSDIIAHTILGLD